MTRILTFDICSVIILAFLILSLFLRKMTKGRANIMFLIIISMIMLSGILDILRFGLPAFIPHNKVTRIILYIIHYLYLMTRNYSTSIYTLFVFAVCGLWHGFRSESKLHTVWAVPLFIINAIMFVDLFVHKLFYITDELLFQRGILMYGLYFCAFWCMAISIFFCIKNRHFVSRIKYITLMLLFPISIVGIIIQMLYPNVLVEIFTSAFPMLIISLVVQKSEEIINNDTGSLNYYACYEDVNKNFLAEIPMKILFIQIKDFKLLIRQYKEEEIQSFLSALIQNIYAITGNDECDVYYMDDGMITVVSTKNDPTIIQEKAHIICEMFNNIEQNKQINLKVKAKLCLARCPEDLVDISEVVSFFHTMDTSIHKTNELVYLEEESKSMDFQIKHHLDAIITRAIKNRSFQMYYQPIYNLNEKKFTSAEALIRLTDPKYGFISPALFIPAAENSGAIHQIGDFVLDEVCRFYSEHNLKDLGIDYIEINLSAAQCIEKNLNQKVEAVLEKYKLDSSSINLEITETSVDINHKISDQNIQLLSENGISFSLDDYGTGYSNIKRVMSLPLHIIKLDKSFADEFNKAEMQIVIKSTVNMLKKINKKILIEGVESAEGKNYFENVGCDFIQGYFYSRPLSQRDFIIFLKENEGRANV